MKKCKTCGKECKYELCNSCRAKERREKHKHDKCKHCGREGVYSKGLCYKHWKQLKEFGEFKDCNSRNKTDLNEIIFYDDYAEIIICDNNYNEKTRVLIDIEDSEKVKDFKWYIDKNEYIVSKCKKTGHKGLYLHRFIMNCPKDMVVDHINHNTLDNRKFNLRICTQHENTFNKKENGNDKGVFLRGNKWIAQISYNYKNIYLGRFDTYEEALKVRKEAEIKYFGEFRNKENE